MDFEYEFSFDKVIPILHIATMSTFYPSVKSQGWGSRQCPRIRKKIKKNDVT